MRWFPLVNLGLVLAICGMMGAFLVTSNDHDEEISFITPVQQKRELPNSPFFVEGSDHDFEEGALALKWVPPQMQLPDLRGELIFYGKNGRPDNIPGKRSYHLALKGSQERKLIPERERTYLIYKGNYTPPSSQTYRETISPAQRPIWGEVTPQKERESYIFSPDNQPTALWLEVAPLNDQEVAVRVNMLDEKGALVASPQELCSFSQPLQDFPKAETMGWDLGKYRVDTTLLVRQKARWIGPDLFLEMHGGEEFAYALGRERIDFFDPSTPYSCFVKEGDLLIWKEERWEVADAHQSTQNLPLMVVRKIDEKIISFDLWDPEGKGKVALSLLRSREAVGTPNLSQEFKFVGAKTWAQFIVENRDRERITLKPQDWLVLTENGWIKLDTPEQIDDYIEHRLTGPLFIFDKMTRQNGRQVLVGHLFNTSRTQVETVELPASSNTSLANFYRNIPISPPINSQTMEGHEE